MNRVPVKSMTSRYRPIGSDCPLTCRYVQYGQKFPTQIRRRGEKDGAASLMNVVLAWPYLLSCCQTYKRLQRSLRLLPIGGVEPWWTQRPAVRRYDACILYHKTNTKSRCGVCGSVCTVSILLHFNRCGREKLLVQHFLYDWVQNFKVLYFLDRSIDRLWNVFDGRCVIMAGSRANFWWIVRSCQTDVE